MDTMGGLTTLFGTCWVPALGAAEETLSSLMCVHVTVWFVCKVLMTDKRCDCMQCYGFVCGFLVPCVVSVCGFMFPCVALWFHVWICSSVYSFMILCVAAWLCVYTTPFRRPQRRTVTWTHFIGGGTKAPGGL